MVVNNGDQFYKIKLCPFLPNCRKGNLCSYAHSTEDLRVPISLKKTKLCDAWKKGLCIEATCKFAHGEAELRSTPAYYKTNYCKFWAKGNCEAGENCRHAHGKEELRKSIPTLTSKRKRKSKRMVNLWNEPCAISEKIQIGCNSLTSKPNASSLISEYEKLEIEREFPSLLNQNVSEGAGTSVQLPGIETGDSSRSNTYSSILKLSEAAQTTVTEPNVGSQLLQLLLDEIISQPAEIPKQPRALSDTSTLTSDAFLPLLDDISIFSSFPQMPSASLLSSPRPESISSYSTTTTSGMQPGPFDFVLGTASTTATVSPEKLTLDPLITHPPSLNKVNDWSFPESSLRSDCLQRLSHLLFNKEQLFHRGNECVHNTHFSSDCQHDSMMAHFHESFLS